MADWVLHLKYTKFFWVQYIYIYKCNENIVDDFTLKKLWLTFNADRYLAKSWWSQNERRMDIARDRQNFKYLKLGYFSLDAKRFQNTGQVIWTRTFSYVGESFKNKCEGTPWCMVLWHGVYLLLIDNDEDSQVQVHFVLLKERGRDRNEDGKLFGVGFGDVFDKKKNADKSTILISILYLAWAVRPPTIVAFTKFRCWQRRCKK